VLCNALKSQNGKPPERDGGREKERRERERESCVLGSAAAYESTRGGRGRYRMHRCPAARVTGTGCNRTPITYVRTAAGEIGKEEEKGRGGDKSERTRGDAKCG